MIFKYVFSAMLFLLPLSVQGQQKEYKLNGYVYIKDGPACRYDVVFTASGRSITGYSITMQPDGRALNARINGSIDRKNQTLSFVETKMPLVTPAADCMFNVLLSYRLTNGGYLFAGSFTGKNSTGDFCDEGTVKLEIKKEAARIFRQENPKKKPAIKQVITPTVDIEQPPELSKITSAIHKEFEWHTDTCVLEIWDGEVVDGDIVTIRLNGKEVLTGYTLAADKKELILPLRGKINRITIFAENEGKAPPNTSMILLLDGKTQHGVLACIKKGETAQIMISKR